MDIDSLELVGFAESMPIVGRAAHIPTRTIEGLDIASTELANGDIAEVPKRTVIIVPFIQVEVIVTRIRAAEGDRFRSPVCVLVIKVEISNVHARGNTRRTDSEATIGIKIGIA